MAHILESKNTRVDRKPARDIWVAEEKFSILNISPTGKIDQGQQLSSSTIDLILLSPSSLPREYGSLVGK